MNKHNSLIINLIVVFCSYGCIKDKVIEKPFNDNFDRPEIGSNYLNTGGPYRILNNQLNIKGSFNHPLWLKKKLPRNAIIEFDVSSKCFFNN